VPIRYFKQMQIRSILLLFIIIMQQEKEPCSLQVKIYSILINSKKDFSFLFLSLLSPLYHHEIKMAIAECLFVAQVMSFPLSY